MLTVTDSFSFGENITLGNQVDICDDPDNPQTTKNDETNSAVIKLVDKLYMKEQEYLLNLKNDKNYGLKFIENKIFKIKTLLQELDAKCCNSRLSEKDLTKIKNLAISKGGLLLNSFRRAFLKKAFSLNDHNIKFIYFKNGEFECKYYDLKDYYTDNIGELDGESKKNNYDYIIEVDVKRSIANHFFDREQDEELISKLKERIIRFLKKFIKMNKMYHYYQGFHDIALYIYLIFYNSEHLALQMLQRMSEFYLKDYLVELEEKREVESNSKNSKTHFKFETVFQILNKIMGETNTSTAKFINENVNITDPVFSLPWVITIFTHDISDYFLVSRIFDCILFSHPHMIFHITSDIILTHTNEIKNKFNSRYSKEFLQDKEEYQFLVPFIFKSLFFR